MRDKLKELIEKTIIYQYALPCKEHGIERVCFSTQNDDCYNCINTDDLVKIIYNSIIEYSYETFPKNDYNKLQNMHSAALSNKIKYIKDEIDNDTNAKAGFFGEVLLCTILKALYGKDSFISRGRFFDPLENSETKGYDSYHIFNNGGQIELWFGEVKFHESHNSAIKSVMENIDKALSMEYLEQTFYSIDNKIEGAKPNAESVKQILENWKYNDINLIEQIKKYNFKLVYPILLVYGANTLTYESNITKVVNYIKSNYSDYKCSLDIPYSIFFILLPVHEVKEIKKEVLKWIEEKKQVLL